MGVYSSVYSRISPMGYSPEGKSFESPVLGGDVCLAGPPPAAPVFFFLGFFFFFFAAPTILGCIIQAGTCCSGGIFSLIGRFVVFYFLGHFGFTIHWSKPQVQGRGIQCRSFTPLVTPFTCDSAGSAIAATISL